MDELNGHRSFTDAGGYTPDEAVPHISGGEDTGYPDIIQHAVGLAA